MSNYDYYITCDHFKLHSIEKVKGQIFTWETGLFWKIHVRKYWDQN